MKRIPGSWLAAIVFAAALPVGAADGPVFYSGGQAHPLVESTTELYVTTNPDATGATMARLAQDPNRKVTPLPWAPRAANHCIIKTQDTGPDARAKIRDMDGVADVRPIYRFTDSDTPLLSSGNLVVRLDTSMTAAERTEFFEQYLVTLVSTIDAKNGVYTVRPSGTVDTDEVARAAAMYGDDRTVFAHPDFVVETETKQFLSQFNDQFFNQQWHLNNTGQGGGTIGADINITEAWRITFGEDVLFGILDDSVDVQHEDLLPNYIGIGHDAFLAVETGSAPNPRNILDLHGTAVLGLAVADANDVGVLGVAPAALWTASRGIGDPTTLGQLASAFVFARQRSVGVHINSWGLVGVRNSQADVLVAAIESAFEEGRDGKGMMIVFAAGNDSAELGIDDDLSTLPSVLGVGASNANDEFVFSYSNFGLDIDVLAPSWDSFLPGMVTTDNTDEAGFVSPGFNFGGTSFDGFGNPIPDLSDSSYTQHFSGTSAACPVAAGVAGLILSANQDLTVGQIRTIMEQTCDKIDAAAAIYDPMTERSVTHTYGRINAGAAVQAADESRDNGGFTWPPRLADVRLSGGTLSWTLGDDIREVDDDNDPETDPLLFGERTSTTLVLESASPFSTSNAFVPFDATVYTVGQVVSSGITVVQNSQGTALALPNSSATRYYALFPVNAIGRYAFGVTIDTEGNVFGIGGGEGGTGTVGETPSSNKPRASIHVTPLSGDGPLEVRFQGNAQTENDIESLIWDFGDGETSDRATTTHRYDVTGGESQTFFPTFTVTDEFGNTGTRTVAIHVTGAGIFSTSVAGDLRIIVGLPGSVGSDVDSGVSPFSVELNIDGSPAGEIQSVSWDLGDGTTADTVSVPHKFVNNTPFAQTFPISVRVSSTTPAGTVVQSSTRFVTVRPDPNPPEVVAAELQSDTSNLTAASSPAQTIPGTCGTGISLAFAAFAFLSFTRRTLH